MSLNEILSWDDYNSWGEWNKGELKNLPEQEVFEELKNFRGDSWANDALSWLENGFPPIILTYNEFGPLIGDGRGRTSLAVGMNVESLPVIVLNEDERGDICFDFDNGKIK